MSVAAVVVNWNGYDVSARCLSALREEDVAVVLVDNGSEDGSGGRLASDFPRAALVRSDWNRGFAGGANLGIRRALEDGAEFVWLLNNDAVPDPGAVERLVAETSRDPRVGVVGAVLSGEWGAGRVGRWSAVTASVAGPGEFLDYVDGACMLVRRAVFEDVGLLDEAFFFYYEDADFCLRAHAAGWRLTVARGARVEHPRGTSVNRGSEGRSGRADLLQAESSGIFIGKHFGGRRWPACAVRLAGLTARRIARGQAGRLPALAVALTEGVRVGTTRRGRPSR